MRKLIRRLRLCRLSLSLDDESSSIFIDFFDFVCKWYFSKWYFSGVSICYHLVEIEYYKNILRKVYVLFYFII